MDAPILIVSDVPARLVRRGLVEPDDPLVIRWRGLRVLVFAAGPVRYELKSEPAPPR